MAEAKTQALTACRFYVKLERKGCEQAVFSEMGGLSVEMTPDEIEEGGLNGFTHRLPTRCKVSNLTLKRGMVASNDFYKWMMEAAQGKIEPVNLSVTLYNTDGQPALSLNLIKAYPIKWSTPGFRADENAVAIETLELAHEGFEVK